MLIEPPDGTRKSPATATGAGGSHAQWRDEVGGEVLAFETPDARAPESRR